MTAETDALQCVVRIDSKHSHGYVILGDLKHMPSLLLLLLLWLTLKLLELPVQSQQHG